MQFNSKLLHAGISPDNDTGAIVPPIHLSTTYAFYDVGKNKGFDYARTGNPTRQILENNLAALEGGSQCTYVASGLGAETVILNLFKKDDHIICGNDVYGGSIRLFNHYKNNFGLNVEYLDLRDIKTIEKSIKMETKAIWIETPSNPLLNIVDLAAISKIVHQHGILMIVDNTFMSPYFQQPLKFGADIVMHSTTKYLSGHNDGLGGAIICNDDYLAEKIAFNSNALGIVGGAFDSYLLLRGLKTLAVRLNEQERSAFKIAQFLENHSAVNKVYYPGLKSHPRYDIAARQMTGFGGMLSFEINGDIKDVENVLRSTKFFHLAESFGCVESLIQHPKTMSHASLTAEEQITGGITDELIRISIGLEDVYDLINDLKGALKQ